MVAKITTGKNIYGALQYNNDKLEAEKAYIMLSNKMINIINSEKVSISQIMKGFEVCLTNNNRTQEPIIHISINPDPKDKLSDETLSKIIRDYMEKMGYEKQPYIAYKHKDIDREHIHIVSVRVDEKGQKIDDSFQYKRSMSACRAIEKQYNLHPATPRQRKEGEPLQKIDYKRGDIKHKLSNIVKTLAKDYKFQSLKEYKTLLNLYNVTFDEVQGVERGKPYHGIIYSVTNDKGEKVGVPFKSSIISQFGGSKALLKHCAIPIKKERAKIIIHAAMQNYTNRKNFESELKKNHIDTVFRENSQGRIYGVTFIDHDTKSVFNGSRLGKEFSANVFNEMFAKSREKAVVDIQQNDLSNNGLLDLFTIDSSNSIDYEEEAFIKRMKRKKKKQHKI